MYYDYLLRDYLKQVDRVDCFYMLKDYFDSHQLSCLSIRRLLVLDIVDCNNRVPELE